MITIVAAVEECQRVMKTSDIPCIVYSSYRPADCNAQVLIFNNTPENILNTTWQNSTPFCKFTWNLSGIMTYSYNSTIETGMITIEADDNMIFLLFIPLALCFFFIFWGNSLDAEQEPLKWFMRLLSLIMIFSTYVGANIIIAMNPGYEDLEYVFNITAITWIFYTIMSVFLIYIIYRIFIGIKIQKQNVFQKSAFK